MRPILHTPTSTRTGYRVALDAALAVALAVASVGIALPGSAGHKGLDPTGVGLLLLQTLPLVVRRRWPLPVLLATGAGIFAYSALQYPLTVAGTGVLVAFYTVVADTGRRLAVASALAAAIAIPFSVLLGGGSGETVISTYGVYAAIFLLGENVRVRRAYTEEAEARLAALAGEREERERRAIAEERVRIARELHDIVAHHVSVMVIQAGAGGRALDSGADGVRDALAAIGATGRSALEELRRMLGVLRADEAPASRAPEPGLERIGTLLGQVGAAGLDVELRIEGEPATLPAGVDLTAYRVIQEALTNVLKHAATGQATVTLRYVRDALDIEIADDGPGRAPASAPSLPGGHGLAGMRERVSLYGGSLEAGPRAGGGFAVHARLPITEPGPQGLPGTTTADAVVGATPGVDRP